MGEAEIPRNVSIAVGTSAVLISPQLQYGQRKALALTNSSTGGQIIYIYWGQQPISAAGGVPLYPTGGSWSESVDSVFVPLSCEVWAIGSAVSGILSVHERVGRGL